MFALRVTLPLAAALFAACPTFAAPEGPPFYDRQRSLEKQREAAKAAVDEARSAGPEVARYFADPSVQVRDEVFEALVARGSEELLGELERLLEHKDPFVAATVAELYGQCRYAPGREALERRGLRARDEQVVLESIWALEAIADPAAAPALEKAFERRRSPFRVRGDALIALAALDPERARPHVQEALEDDPPLQVAGLEALRRIDGRAAAAAAVDVVAAPPMKEKLRGWEARVLFAALDALAGWRERAADRDLAVRGVDALIARLERAEGLSRYRVALALADLTGEPLGDDVEIWRGWWKPRRERFTPPEPAAAAPPERAKGKGKRKDEGDAAEGEGRKGPLTGDGARTRVRFHGIPIRSNRLLFAQDISGGMRNPLERDEADSPSKLEFSNRELKRVLGALGDDVHANVAFFATKYELTADRLLPVAKVRAQLIEFVGQKAVIPDGTGMSRSNLYDTLAVALADPEIDTIFFLSEGGPTEGRYLETERFMRHLRLVNRYSRVQVHCLQVTTSKPGERFLRRLAAETGGEFYDLDAIKRAHGL